MTKNIQSIADLVQDKRNANRGTERGNWMLRRSLERNGAGRSIVADKNGNLIAGNKTAEAALEAGMRVRVVQTDGTELVVVQRTDLDLDDPRGKARELAFADNRVGEVNLDWDIGEIVFAKDSFADIDVYWRESELNDLRAALEQEYPNPLETEELDKPTRKTNFSNTESENNTSESGGTSTERDNAVLSVQTRLFYLYVNESKYETFTRAVNGLKEKYGLETNSDAIVQAVIDFAELEGVFGDMGNE